MPQQQEANASVDKFFQRHKMPNVFGCIDGTQIRIQAPSEFEYEFVNRKNYHSLNVQVVCDFNLMFINCVSHWLGSVHDARIPRESTIFHDFEAEGRKPIQGVLFGDSGYMARDWLFTPLANPTTDAERSYNDHHSSARSRVEQLIGILKHRWHCLRRLRVDPLKASKVILVCVMLHNQARSLNLDDPSDSEDEDDGDMDSDNEDCPAGYQASERVRSAVGKEARRRYVNTFFPLRR